MKIKSFVTSILSIIITAALLLGVGLGLAKVAEVKQENEFTQIMLAMMPGSTSFQWEEYEGEDEAVMAVYKGETGYVIQTVTYGYAGNITMLVGVSNAGKVTGLKILDMSETHGLGAKAVSDVTFLAQYLGTSGEAEVGTNIDALTGATVSSKAITKGVNAAVAYVTGADTTSSATTWGG